VSVQKALQKIKVTIDQSVLSKFRKLCRSGAWLMPGFPGIKDKEWTEK